MKRSSKIAIGVAAALGLGTGVAVFAHPGGMGPGMMGPGMVGPGMMGPGMGGPMAGRMQNGDASFADDMRLVHAMLFDHDKIKRTVANLSDGIRTVTESDDPGVARAIKAHVASMEKRLGDGKIFNLFSPTLPVLFENKDKIKTAVVTQTSGDPKVVAALQAHAIEVSELARDGMAAMMRNMRASMMARAAQR